jgi:Tfp pilus assembly protein PilE
MLLILVAAAILVGSLTGAVLALVSDSYRSYRRERAKSEIKAMMNGSKKFAEERYYRLVQEASRNLAS